MLLSVEDSNNKIGNVFQADDMNRIMSDFFNTISSDYSTDINEKPMQVTKFSKEDAEFKFELINAKKSQDKIIINVKIAGLPQEEINYLLQEQKIRLYDRWGNSYELSSIKIENTIDSDYRQTNYIFPKNVVIPYEITFTGCKDIGKLSILLITFSNGENLTAEINL